MTPQRNKRIPGLESYRRRPPNGTFETLPFEARRDALMWLSRLCQRWGSDLPPWRLGILTGVAKRLALHPLGPAWSRHMFAVKGGKAAQRRHRREGIDVMALARAAKVSNKPKTAQKNPVRHLDL
jgi:hypothetical protein